MARRGTSGGSGWILTGCAALILSVAVLILYLAVPGGAQDRIGGPFTLTDDEGRVATERNFAGRYMAVYFGYTHCQDVCPETLNTLTGALSHMGAGGSRIRPVFVTVDPARDTPEVMHRYVRAFSPVLVGLTGPAAAVRKMEDEYRVISLPSAEGIDHSSVIDVMGPDGNFVGAVPADASEMVMAQALARYVGQGK